MVSDRTGRQGYDNPLEAMASGASIDEITKRREEALKHKAILEEEIIEYKMVINRLASTPDGQYFLRKLIKFAGIYSFDNDINPAKMVEDRGKRRAYVELVRPFLETSTRITLESET